ncbi:chorismate mutase [Chloroflexota bacterium]
MRCRGIRGATVVEENTKEAILHATRELLEKMIEANQIEVDEVAYAFFTTTPDVNAEFPALAARQLGWTQTALLCGHEMNVPGSLKQCIRILVLYNTEKTAAEIAHVYTKGAERLRMDISS